MKQRLADYIADFAVRNGISQCFTVTGGGAMHLNDAFGHKEGLRCTYNHHEQACSIAAEGYARAGSKLPLVCVTSGPGGTNALTGVLGAWLDSIPMFVISGQVKRETTVSSTTIPLRQLGDQEYHIIAVAKEMTKYSAMITEPESIAYHLEKALFLAKNGRCGPVWLDIPLDIQNAIIETDSLKHYDSAWDEFSQNPKYNQSVTQGILEKLEQAKRPVLFVGEGVRMANALEEFRVLVEKLQIPVVTAWNAHDVLPDSSSFFCGRPGTLGTRGGNFVVQNCDFLLVLGCRLNVRQISYSWDSFAPDAYKIMVDIDAAELFKPTLCIDEKINANVKDVIESICSKKYLPPQKHFVWLEKCKDLNLLYPAVSEKHLQKKTSLNPYAFMQELSKRLREDETIVTGNGSACVITFQAIEIKKGQRLFTNSGCASMGYGLPAAIGAGIATNKDVICIDGDGSFMMNLQELSTISCNQIPLKIFLINNNGYHSIRQTQKNIFGHNYMVGIGPESGDLTFPDFSAIASAFGINYCRIKSLEEAQSEIEAIINYKGPIICEVVVDPEQFFEPKLASYVSPSGEIKSPELDDMYPFIPREEYERCKEDCKNCNEKIQ